MGFYINSCPKMAYKVIRSFRKSIFDQLHNFIVYLQAQFLPSDLLCSETFRWVSIEVCLAKLLQSNRPYVRFCDDPLAEDDDGKVDDTLVMLYHQDDMTSLQAARTKYSLEKPTMLRIREYAKLVGKKCAPELLYYLS